MIPAKLFKFLQPIYHFLMAWLAALLYGFPSEKLIVIGVTGTTGKTTSAYMMLRMLEAAGIKTGLTSTAVFNNGKKEWLNDKKMTMVGRFFTQKIMKQMIRNGCKAAIIETTSEGVRQFRHRFINYDFVAITGLYPEHIESHGSFEKYKEAKGKLFAHLKHCGIKHIDENYAVCKPKTSLAKLDFKRLKKAIIVNGDDDHAGYFLQFWAERKLAYVQGHMNGLPESSALEMVRYGNIRPTTQGVSFEFSGLPVDLKMLGAFNVENAMTAAAVGLALELPKRTIKTGLEAIEGVAGRLEKIDEGQPYTVLIDYAFEPNAVKKLYDAIKGIPHGKIIHLLGSAGGGRDVARRPVLGKMVGQYADYVIVTNEDPYDDDPEIIIDQVALGAEQAGKKSNVDLFKVSDRLEAFQKAFKLAKSGDMVLITGKGSEQAICTANGEKIPWDDRAVARGLLRNEYKQL